VDAARDLLCRVPMPRKTEYTSTTHDAVKDQIFGPPDVADDDPAWEFHSWRLDGKGRIVALWHRTWHRRR
jgi:hypothetical protein